MDDKVELREQLKRVQLKLLRKKGITKETVDVYNQLTGDDVARPATDPEQRDEEVKKMVKDELGEVLTEKFTCERRLIGDDMEKIQKELLKQFASLREHDDAKFKELATGQGDALRVALQGISQKLAALEAERKKASETTGSGETNILEKIEALLRGVDANTKALSRIESEVASFGGKIKNMEHRINVNTAKELKTLPGLTKELHGSETNAPVVNASVALETDTPTQTTGQDTGKKKKKNKAQSRDTPTVTVTTTTKKVAKCMATKENGEPCRHPAKNGFLTCGYGGHRKQEEELRKTTLQHADSTASFQDTATNAQAPPTTTQPSVAPRKSSRLRPSGVATRKRKRDEEELEHNHSPGEIGEDCPACLQGATLTEPSSHILHSEEADQRDYSFESPEPENRVAHGLPPSPPLNGPILSSSPTPSDGQRLDQYLRPEDQAALMREIGLEHEKPQQRDKPSSSKQRLQEEDIPYPPSWLREPNRRNTGSPWY